MQTLWAGKALVATAQVQLKKILADSPHVDMPAIADKVNGV